MEAFLKGLLPRVLLEGCTFACRVFRGKEDLLRKLGNRLKGYRHWLPDGWRIVVVVDRDNDDCSELKDKLEQAADHAGLLTRSRCQDGEWQVVNRIAIEELEAWYFGDWAAVRQAYPRVPLNVPNKAPCRDPNDIQGPTWEAFERILKRTKQIRSRRGSRRLHRPGAQPFAEFQSVLQSLARGDRATVAESAARCRADHCE